MKVSVELNVSDKEFYDVMMKSLQEELNHVSKKKLELKEGLKYKKKINPKKRGWIRNYSTYQKIGSK